MFALFADAASDAQTIGPIVGVVALLGTMLKMLWSDRTRGATIEAALRKSFAEERTAREIEVTAEKANAKADYAAAKADYSESLIRHQQIHAQEIAAFQARITGYIEQLDHTKERVSVLEAEVKELRAR